MSRCGGKNGCSGKGGNNGCSGGSNNSGCSGQDNTALSCFFSIPAAQFSLLSSLLGVLLIDNLDLNQQNSLGNFLVGVGQNLLTAAAQGALLESSSQQNDHVRQQINSIRKQLSELERELND